jgi:hypothetical protein
MIHQRKAWRNTPLSLKGLYVNTKVYTLIWSMAGYLYHKWVWDHKWYVRKEFTLQIFRGWHGQHFGAILDIVVFEVLLHHSTLTMASIDLVGLAILHWILACLCMIVDISFGRITFDQHHTIIDFHFWHVSYMFVSMDLTIVLVSFKKDWVSKEALLAKVFEVLSIFLSSMF